jgi:hypothetical protein
MPVAEPVRLFAVEQPPALCRELFGADDGTLVAPDNGRLGLLDCCPGIGGGFGRSEAVLEDRFCVVEEWCLDNDVHPVADGQRVEAEAKLRGESTMDDELRNEESSDVSPSVELWDESKSVKGEQESETARTIILGTL